MPLNIIQAPDEGATFIESHPTRPFLLVHTQQAQPRLVRASVGPRHRVGGRRGLEPHAERHQDGLSVEELQDRLLAEVLTGISQDDAFTTWDMQARH